MIKLFENFSSLEDVKETIFNYAVETHKPEIIEFFLDRGYDIDTDDALDNASYDLPTFKFMLDKGADIEFLSEIKMKNLEIQKILIDYGHEYYVHDSVGFHYLLKNDPEYANVVKRFEDMKKYNL